MTLSGRTASGQSVVTSWIRHLRPSDHHQGRRVSGVEPAQDALLEDLLHDIAMHDPSPEFIDCWSAAGNFLDDQVQGGNHSWLKATPNPPSLEHLSFRLGNQLFFVRVEDVDDRVDAPGSLHGLLSVAQRCNGHACLMPMRRVRMEWRPVHAGWGLVDALSGRLVDPVALVSDERVEMTSWEVQDLMVQTVRDALEAEGLRLMSWQSNPEVEPSIWFVGDNGEPQWVIVRPALFPLERAAVPANLAAIAEACARTGLVGHFASVGAVCVDALVNDYFEGDGEEAGEMSQLPLWRGHGIDMKFDGLEQIWPSD